MRRRSISSLSGAELRSVLEHFDSARRVSKRGPKARFDGAFTAFFREMIKVEARRLRLQGHKNWGEKAEAVVLRRNGITKAHWKKMRERSPPAFLTKTRPDGSIDYLVLNELISLPYTRTKPVG
jgi:hypothetical protein